MGKVIVKTRRLLICPTCESNGFKEVLGELDENGNLEVLRFSDKKTKVISSRLAVQCGKCGEIAFFRKENSAGNER